MFDFPSAPTVGQKYPATPVQNVPTYTWDGEKWTTIGAPTGGRTPVYTDGSTPMAAALTLAGDPANPTDAADKHYVDNAIATNVPPPAFPSGTVMLFYQASAPTGWTKLTTQNDKALRVVSGNGGVAGGTNAFSTVMAQSVVGNHTLTLAETAAGMTSSGSGTIYTYPNGTGSYYVPMSVGGWAGAPITTATGYWVPYDASGNNNITYTNQWSGGNSFSVTNNNASGGAHNHPITMAIQYIDVILASKN
jgi:hypothetical protein